MRTLTSKRTEHQKVVYATTEIPIDANEKLTSGRSRATNTRVLRERLALSAPCPELLGLIALAAALNLWALSRNGWANQYYAAAVKSMSSSWHDFLFASLDHGGVMTVDKPPLALWVQALSVRVFGFHSLSILVPQALMGVASVGLLYDLVRRRFGRVGGFVAGLALAVTPISVAISRHNNPDALLVLCTIAALWCTVRALEGSERTQTRWLVLAGVCVGLGFETKMLVALVVVPGIVLAWLWTAPGARSRLNAIRQLLYGGAAMTLVGGAWPLLVELTPAVDRPWISGTSDNRILSLIFEYNGLGRVDGQAGGPGGSGAHAAGHAGAVTSHAGGFSGPGGGGMGNVFGGSTGPLRLLNSALGGQAGWLLGFALISAVGILFSSRLRRTDQRAGWLIAIGGGFAITAVLFSFASGIFHPYYVSLLAPFIAALVGAGTAEMLRGGVHARIFGPVAIAAGIATELAVLGNFSGQLTWLAPLLISLGLLSALAIAFLRLCRVRVIALATALVMLLIAPGVWAFDTLGHATSGTFPEGGPSSALASAGGPGGLRGFGRSGQFAGPGPGAGAPTGAPPQLQLFGSGSGQASGAGQTGAPGFGPAGTSGSVGTSGGGPMGAPIGGSVTASVLAYVKAHGGGTIAVASQSNAASAILEQNANVAGIGGFSGRESDISLAWLAQEVSNGKIRWVIDEEVSSATTGARGLGVSGDTRTGARTVMAAVARECKAVKSTLYDCAGRASALSKAG